MRKNKKSNSGLVYSTEQGRMCPECNSPVANCQCADLKTVATKDDIVRVRRETKGRKGKGMTIITGIPLDQAQLKKFAKELKKKCGSGGTVKAGVIEIQGDHREVLMIELKKQGWTVKAAGG